VLYKTHASAKNFRKGKRFNKLVLTCAIRLRTKVSALYYERNENDNYLCCIRTVFCL